MTASRPDYAVATRTATVAPASGPFLHVTQVTINDDGIPPSSGNAKRWHGWAASSAGFTLSAR